MSLRDKYTDEELEEISQRKLDLDKYRFTRVEILSDDSGHDYVVPYDLSERFRELIDQGEEAEDLFDSEFGQFACGGDCFGQYEFYVKAN